MAAAQRGEETLPALTRPQRGLFLVPAEEASPALHPLAKAFAKPAPALPAHLLQGAETLAEARRIVAQIEQEIEARAARDRNNVRARLYALEMAAQNAKAPKASGMRSVWQRLTRAVGL